MNAITRRVLFPTDFSRTGDVAMQLAVSFASHAWAELVIVHVQEPGQSYLGDYYYGTVEPSDEDLARMLTELIPQKKQLRCRTELLRGRPALAIPQFARDNQTDLIVIGTHGCSGLASVIVGSVAEEVIRNAPCPVLAIRTLSSEHEPSLDFTEPTTDRRLGVKELLDTLDDLITINVDSQHGLREAAADVHHGGLKILLADRADQHRDFAEELQLLAALRGDVPNRRGSLQGRLYRKWIQLSAALGDDASVVKACVREEGHASREYVRALQLPLPDDVRESLRRHLAEIDLLSRGLRGVQQAGVLECNKGTGKSE